MNMLNLLWPTRTRPGFDQATHQKIDACGKRKAGVSHLSFLAAFSAWFEPWYVLRLGYQPEATCWSFPRTLGWNNTRATISTGDETNYPREVTERSIRLPWIPDGWWRRAYIQTIKQKVCINEQSFKESACDVRCDIVCIVIIIDVV